MESEPIERVDEAGLLRAFLAERDCACPGCGYNLRMLESNRCPECAMEVQLGVRLAEPRLGALITGVIALAAGAGFGGLLVGFGVLMLLLKGPGGGADRFFVVNGTVAVVNGVALWMWLRCWRYVRRWPAGRRMGLALACWLLPTLGMLALVKWVR
jgi:hypothetical protein